MYGYKLQIPKSIPELKWACKTKVEQYNWQNRNKSNTLELSLCRASARSVVWLNSSPEILTGTTLSCILGDEWCQSYADDGVEVEILSVAVTFDELSYVPKEFDMGDISDESVLLLPRTLTDLSEQTATRIENLIYRIMEAYKEQSASSRVACVSIVLQLLFELDQITRLNVKRKKDKYLHYYVGKAESILMQRYNQKLTVKSIASELSVSPNYLSFIFKSVFGIGMTDRLLEIRMKKAAALLVEEGLSESEVALSVGYDDIGHFRRRFKQYYGVSIRDYCCISKEMTLYHAKPQKAKV